MIFFHLQTIFFMLLGDKQHDSFNENDDGDNIDDELEDVEE